MSPGPLRAPEPNRREIERELQQAVETARAELNRASAPADRAQAAERLKAAVKQLMEFTRQ